MKIRSHFIADHCRELANFIGFYYFFSVSEEYSARRSICWIYLNHLTSTIHSFTNKLSGNVPIFLSECVTHQYFHVFHLLLLCRVRRHRFSWKDGSAGSKLFPGHLSLTWTRASIPDREAICLRGENILHATVNQRAGG